MVRGLSALSRLERLELGFQSPLSHPVRRTHRPSLLSLIFGLKRPVNRVMSRIALAVQELAGEMSPSLQKILLEDFHPSEPVDGAIGSVATRQLSSHPVAVFHSDRIQDKW